MSDREKPAESLAREQQIRELMNQPWAGAQWRIWCTDLLDLLASERQARAALEQLSRHFGIAGDFDNEEWVKWSDVRAALHAGEDTKR
jgi:hypothetical protein